MPLAVGSNARRAIGRNIRRLRVSLPTTAQTTVTKDARLRTVPAARRGGAIEFVFPFAPIEISYENLSPEWVEIDRPLNTPLIDLKGLNLMRVSLRFLVAVPYDGIRVSVDNDIRTLRQIANSNDPVAFINMDRMLTNPFNVSRSDSRRNSSGFFFRVADMSVQSIRRNIRNEITSAEVSMTLQETANPPIRAIYFAPINYSVATAPTAVVTKKSAPQTSTLSYFKLTEAINLAEGKDKRLPRPGRL